MAITSPADAGSATATASVATITVDTSVTLPSVAKLWVVVMGQNGATSVASVTGGALTFVKDFEIVQIATLLSIFSADVPAGLASGTTLTITYAVATSDRGVALMYSTGVAIGHRAYTYGSLGQHESGSTWTSLSRGVASGDMMIGASHFSIASGSPTSIPSGGNTEVHDITTADGESFTTVYQIGTGAQIAAQGTWSSPSGIVSGAVSYRASTYNTDYSAFPKVVL